LDNAGFEGNIYFPSGSGLTLGPQNKMDEKLLIKRRNSQIILALILWFCVGSLSGESPDPYLIILVNIGLAVTITLLLITLSQLRNRPIIRSLHWIIYITWPVAFPMYLIKFYRWKGVGILMVSIITAFAAMFAGSYLAF
jgi:hypothetical protein